MKVSKLIDLYLIHLKAGVCEAHFERREFYLASFQTFIGKRRVSRCLGIDATTWIHATNAWGDWCRNAACTSVKACWNWGMAQGIVKSNPFAGVKFRKGPRGLPVADDHFRAILRATGHAKGGARFRRLLVFIRWTGARSCEAYRLQWDHVDFENGVAVQHQHKTSHTTDRPLVIVLDECMLKLLKWMHARRTSKYVFVNSGGRPWNKNSAGLRMRRIKKRLGLPKSVRIYGLRHQFATESLKGGLDVMLLKEAMNHATIRTTENYLHLAGDYDHLRNALEAARKRRGVRG